MRQDAGGHRKRFEVYYWSVRRVAVSSIVGAGGRFIAPRAKKLNAGVHRRLIAKA